MAITTPRSATQLSVRPYQPGDEPAVLDLVGADRLPGQPLTTREMLAEALAGRSPIDGGWWAELDPPTTEVIHDEAGTVLGVVSYATRSHDGAGFILWLHCREDQAVAEAVLTRATGRLGKRTVHAFEFASALTLGLEGLPARHRPATRRALEAAGFTGRDLWRYMRADLPIAGLPHAAHVTVTESEDPPGKRLEVREGGELLAEATLGRPVAGIGVLWWISVAPPARGRGLGLALLGSALDLLAGLGAREVILYVDDDAPAGDPERDRTAANGMYDRASFTEVDRLHSFTRRP
ncbi:GNAT family N-acetyltransferase [Streptomyces afghaniensis]|uniref:GNAT family N-acetyltransferase n=1 Tax=Streptomyces afghaniensis TaxID=66865 RepID=UPI00278052D0|nr:GNAT family N-acetyltransferase [Streptomyces afghaniensis]MDQ1014322.1 ribosomal protein S18 acetylase RimI-like enzyme [Streptomyces afghaniensis]